MNNTSTRKSVRFPHFEIVNTYGDIWYAFTKFHGQPVTQWGHSANEAETKVREYIARHYQ
ncbi:MAG TPA: hypothetical protein VNH41_07950 [Steroidobacteraceae bacterium]|nr:hypothetical protein [Steroidobacteraceae bacterium]